MPVQGTVEELVARSLTNHVLAARILQFKDNRRMDSRKQVDAYLEEAARRLLWKTEK